MSLGFRNNNRSLVCPFRGKPLRMAIGGVNLQKIMQPFTQTCGYQTVSDLLELERPVDRRNPLSIIRLKNAHSS
jgi:hypothetical protein